MQYSLHHSSLFQDQEERDELGCRPIEQGSPSSTPEEDETENVEVPQQVQSEQEQRPSTSKAEPGTEKVYIKLNVTLYNVRPRHKSVNCQNQTLLNSKQLTSAKLRRTFDKIGKGY